MTITKNERLSALVDNEAEGFEARRLLDELGRSEQDMALWERYHLIGDAVRGGLTRAARPGFADSVMARIADEPMPVRSAGTPVRGLVRPVAGLALAASVAVAVLVGVVNFSGSPEMAVPSVADAQAPATQTASRAMPVAEVVAGGVPADGMSRSGSDRLPMDSPEARLHSFIVNHAEHGAGRGLMPYVRVVGYETPAQ
jgi:sigma-E factor negative regulatory protein RseA